MYEFHAWVTLADTVSEVETPGFGERLHKLRAELAKINWASGHAEIRLYNGRHVFFANGFPNRKRTEAVELRRLINLIADLFRGSYGIVYELDQLLQANEGRGGFVITVVRRGTCTVATDNLLSPIVPTIEDP